MRRLSIWISPEDIVQLIRIGLEHPDIRFDIMYGASDNKRAGGTIRVRASSAIARPARPRTTAPTRMAEQEKVGRDPVGDLFQGGSFCSAEFTNDVKRAGP